MENRKSKENLQRFLGMITYLSKLIPNLSQTAAPLRTLPDKDTEWNWGHRRLQDWKATRAR